MKPAVTDNRRALTRVEVLVIVATLALLAFCLLPMLAKAKAKASRITCSSNMKQVGLGFRIWAKEMGGSYSRQAAGRSDNAEWITSGDASLHFIAMSNQLYTPKVLVCPADTRRAATSWAVLANTNISYFLSLDAEETQPQMFLSGDSNLEVDGQSVGPGLLNLWTNSALGWTAGCHVRQGNIALADGSVQQLSSAKLREFLHYTGVATNRLAIP